MRSRCSWSARAVHPDFALTRQQAPIVSEICRLLDGLPLAIELAAARCKTLSPAALLARLENRLQLLGGETRDLPERLRTMKNAIGWSYDLLTVAQQTLFRRLAVFPGGCCLDAIEAVTGDDPGTPDSMLSLVTALLDHSLLHRVGGPADEPQFAMLGTIRSYALEQLEASGEAEAIWLRHTRWCLSIAERVEASLMSPEREAILDAAERELDNLRSALDRAVANDDAETGLRLTCGMWLFWVQRGYVGEGARWFEHALTSSASTATDVRGPRAKALLGLAGLAEARGGF